MLIAEEESVKPLPNCISKSTRAAVASAMQLRRKNRPQSVREFLALLDGNDNNEETVIDSIKPKAKTPVKSGPSEKHHKWRIPVMLLAAVVIIGFIVYTMLNQVACDVSYDSKNGCIVFPGGSYKMVNVKGGTFNMGSNVSYADEKPMHSVTVSSFYMGKTEVTQALWKAVMGNNPSEFKGDNLPVEKVNWYDCRDFIRRLNSATGKNFRLPTEAEWEFAARGGNKSRGLNYSGSNALGNIAWYKDNADRPHPVGTKQANELGLYDMSGNVWEWCFDRYGEYNSSSQTNPKGPDSGSYRVRRGGSWRHNARRCRVSNRDCYNSPDYKDNFLGFRLVLEP